MKKTKKIKLKNENFLIIFFLQTRMKSALLISVLISIACIVVSADPVYVSSYLPNNYAAGQSACKVCIYF